MIEVDASTSSRPSWAWTGSSCAGRTSSRRTTSRTRPRSASSTTPATTRARWTSCSSTSTSTRSAREQERAARRRASTAASASRPTRRSAAWRRRASTGPSGLRPAGRPLGVGDGARAHHRRGHRLHRHLAARPGPGDELRADRRRPARDRPATGRGLPRRHRRPARGPGHLRLALAGRGRRVGRPRRPTRSQDKAKRIVAHQLEAAPEDIELATGSSPVKGSPDKGMTLAEIARAAYIPENLPEGMEPGLEEIDVLRPGELRVPVRRARGDRRRGRRDRQGRRRPLRRASTTAARRSTRCSSTARSTAASCHAIGQALYERVALRRRRPARHRHVRRLRAARARPRCRPSRLDRTETPSPMNSLGVKGVGEAGTIAASRRRHQRRRSTPCARSA